MEHLPALQVVVPLLTAPLVVLLRSPGLAWAAATAASVMSFIISVALVGQVQAAGTISYMMGSWPAPYGIALLVSSFSALLLLIVTGASTAALLAGRASNDSAIDHSRQPLFYAAWLIALAGMTGIIVAGDAFNIFVSMEIASLSGYILIAAGPDRRALPAVFKYLMMGTIGATFYLIGVGLVYMMTGTLNLADMEARIHEVSELKPILVAAGFITVGLALKAAVFPLHGWLANCYTYAPHIVTAFFAACATKVSVYVLLRFDFLVFQQNLVAHDVQFSTMFVPLAVLAILIPSVSALFEQNVKRLLAYSSIAQMGYIVLGASLVSETGLVSRLVHMFSQDLAKGALFLAVAGLAKQFRGFRNDAIPGDGRTMPWTMAAFTLGGLSLIGVPGTAGFISKWYLVLAALEQGVGGVLLIVAIIAGSLLALVYVWRIVEAAYFGAAASSERVPAEAPLPLLLVTWLVVLANLYFGFFPDLPVSLSEQAASTLLEHLQ